MGTILLKYPCVQGSSSSGSACLLNGARDGGVEEDQVGRSIADDEAPRTETAILIYRPSYHCRAKYREPRRRRLFVPFQSCD